METSSEQQKPTSAESSKEFLKGWKNEISSSLKALAILGEGIAAGFMFSSGLEVPATLITIGVGIQMGITLHKGLESKEKNTKQSE